MDELFQDYQYNSYLAEQEYYQELSKIMETMILEDQTPLQYVLEGLSDAVTNFITKVSASTQSNWNKFKGSVNKQKDFEYLKKIRPTIVSYNSNEIVINNYPEYDLNFLKTIKVIDFDFGSQQDSLKTLKSFMSENYKQINFDNKVSVKKAVKDATLKRTVPNLSIGRDFVIDKFNFNSKGYYQDITSIEADIKVLNNSNQKMIVMSKSIIPNNESLNFRSVYESILLEALPNTGNPNKTQSMSFSDNHGNKLDKRKTVANSSYMRRVKTYLDVATGIITAKMTILNKVYQTNMIILDMIYKQSGGEASKTYKDKQGNPKININI